jgi:hypothetical protein
MLIFNQPVDKEFYLPLREHTSYLLTIVFFDQLCDSVFEASQNRATVSSRHEFRHVRALCSPKVSWEEGYPHGIEFQAAHIASVISWLETLLAGCSHGQVPSPKPVHAGFHEGSLVVYVHDSNVVSEILTTILLFKNICCHCLHKSRAHAAVSLLHSPTRSFTSICNPIRVSHTYCLLCCV